MEHQYQSQNRKNVVDQRQEIQQFLKENPPKERLTSQEINELIISNSELILDIMKEDAHKKNRNITTSNQMTLMTKVERNLIKLIKLTNLGIAMDPTSARNARQHLVKFAKRRR